MPDLCQGSATALRGGLRSALTQISTASAYHSAIPGIRFSQVIPSGQIYAEFTHG
jgi:hypothetical protein